MISSWARLPDGEWGVRLEDAPWPKGTGVGLSVTVRSQSGRKSSFVLGEHIRTWRIKGGRFVDLYRLEKEGDTAS